MSQGLFIQEEDVGGSEFTGMVWRLRHPVLGLYQVSEPVLHFLDNGLRSAYYDVCSGVPELHFGNLYSLGALDRRAR